ncbi:hypothetical protein BU16DRAFT_141592 [Lophium mytilinum]|uniref:DUF7918 domain-containing protein n=1 Tax=Lophium mytilinum TaxID=390894 RepID=A0A6A6QG97_9PEZI|nr:hypothetical protein BU16DRAFT_141592 [Lophium mytilinum]
MAILNDLPGLKVEIVVNGQTLKEYDDDDEDPEEKPRTVTKYIEATSGASFEVRFTFTRLFSLSMYSFAMDIYLDGKFMDNMCIQKNDLFKGPIELTGVRSKKGEQWYLEKFCFSKLAIDDGDPRKIGQTVRDALSKVGEISARLRRIEYRGIAEAPTATKSDGLLQFGSVPEKALKGRALSHQAGLKLAKKMPAVQTINTFNIDPRNSPFATFNFRYRSSDALKALQIIPRSPTPVPLEDRPIEELTLEETRELLKRQRERDAAARKVKQEVKRERNDEGSRPFENDDELTLVEERPRKRFRTVIEDDGTERVDLT